MWTLDTWARSQRLARVNQDDLARDTVAIRDVTIESENARRSSAMEASGRPETGRPPFLFWPAAVRVSVDAGAGWSSVDLPAPSGPTTTIVLSRAEAKTLWDTVERLGTCDPHPRSIRLDKLWESMVGFSKMYCVLGGTWYSEPTVRTIYFMNAERSRAHAVLSTGTDGSGGTEVVVEKRDGAWRISHVASGWES